MVFELIQYSFEFFQYGFEFFRYVSILKSNNKIEQ